MTSVSNRKITLEIIHVPDPCSQPWEAMRGDNLVRHCGVCEKNVYNLSDMKRADAERLVAEHEGNLCVRFFKRADGTVVTADCSAIRKAARRTKRMMATVAAGIVAVFAGTFGLQLARADDALVIPDGTSPGQPTPAGVVLMAGSMAPPQQLGEIRGKVVAPQPEPPATAPATQPK